jgi:hypothetical protein
MRIDERLSIEPLTLASWKKFETLFGREQGGNGGCWCMWWRLNRKEWQGLSKDRRRRTFKKIVAEKLPTGVILQDQGEPVGWCAVAPHALLPTFYRSRISYPIDSRPAWCISCFFVRAGHRRKGHMHNLVKGAIWFAKKNGAVALDAFPQEMEKRASYVDTFVGVSSVFEKCGFKKIASRGQFRSAMRIELNTSKRRADLPKA